MSFEQHLSHSGARLTDPVVLPGCDRTEYSDCMCRNIRVLHNFDPPTTDGEVREAALQFVRKVSGSTRPSRANAEAFEHAIDEIALATRRLLDDLVTNAAPKSRELEAIKGRERHEKRMEREVRTRTASI